MLSRLDPTDSPLAAVNGSVAHRITVPVTLEVALNGIDYTDNGRIFHFQRPWVIDSIQPIWTPLFGGSIITVTGRYFRHTRELMCRFGDTLKATAVSFVSNTAVKCVTPSVRYHGRVSLELSLDAQHWSVRAQAHVVNNLIGTNISLSPGIASHPSRLMPVDSAQVLIGYSGIYLQFYGVLIPYTCGSNVWSNLGYSASATTITTTASSPPISFSPLISPPSVRAAAISHQKSSPASAPASDKHTPTRTDRDSGKSQILASTLNPCVTCITSPVEVADLAGLNVESMALGRTFGLAIHCALICG